jgi:hypothetical protein
MSRFHRLRKALNSLTVRSSILREFVMRSLLIVVIAVCIGGAILSSAASARPVTTDECLARGLCAYVNTKGRVTCGKCPGQVKSSVWFATRAQATSKRSK